MTIIYFIKLTFFQLACWSGDPNKRPTIQQIVSSLKSIISPQENSEEINSIIHAESNKKLPKQISFTIDDDIDLVIGDFIQVYNLDAEEIEIPPYISKQAEKLFKRMFDSIDVDNTNMIIDKLVMLLIRIHDEKGYNFMETNQFINQCISLLN